MSVQVKNLTKIYGLQAAVKQMSFEALPGNILGLLGPNGAGKSTAMKIITGYLKPTAGNVKICGYSVVSDLLEVKKRIGYLPENTPLYQDMYVKEFLTFAAETYALKNVSQRVIDSIKQVGLEAEQHKKISMLSKGYKQRVGLAQAIIHRPEVLILDEPTSGLDPNQLADIRNLIKKLGEDKTVIISTHIMQEAEAICKEVAIINNGQLVIQDSVEHLKTTYNNQSLEEIFRRLTVSQTS